MIRDTSLEDLIKFHDYLNKKYKLHAKKIVITTKPKIDNVYNEYIRDYIKQKEKSL